MKLPIIVVFVLALMTSRPHAQRGTSVQQSGPAAPHHWQRDQCPAAFRNPVGTARIEIHLNRLSTPVQRNQLLQKLKEDGQSGFSRRFGNAPSVGTIG
jgi:hypothetical protein